MYMWSFEKENQQKGYSHIAGIDEVGRGPLAGPVVSAAVILPQTFQGLEVKDSKKLSAKKRDDLYKLIYRDACSIGIGIVDASEIDRINILNASLLSMKFATENLKPQPGFLLIDGKFSISSTIPQKPIIKGDSLSISIAAASIVAKVTRDRMMERYHQDFPQFEFFKHKGYPTKAHRLAIQQYGYSPIHRKSFKGVKEYLQ